MVSGGVVDRERFPGMIEGSVRGFKNMGAPAAGSSAANLYALATTAGYRGTVIFRRPGERAYRTSNYENGAQVARVDDLTPHKARFVNQKQFIDATHFFCTSTHLPPMMDGHTHIYRFKQNLLPALAALSHPYDDVPTDIDLISRSKQSVDIHYSTRSSSETLRFPALGTTSNYSVAPDGTATSISTSTVADNPNDGPVTVSSRQYVRDPLGRAVSMSLDGTVVETWSYPDEFTEVHNDAKGVTTTREYDPQGRLLREVIGGVSGLALSEISGQPAVNLPGQLDYQVTEWLRLTPTEPNSIAKVERRISARTSLTAAMPAPGGWSRSWTSHLDGLGRVIKSSDPLNTIRNMVYTASTTGLVTTVSIPTALGGLISTESTFADGRRASMVYHNPATPVNRGPAGTTQYFDYSAASFARTSRASFVPNATVADGYQAVTVDGLGRTVLTVKPSMAGTVLSLTPHSESRDYDEEGRLLYRSLPGAPTAHYEVYNYTQASGSSDLLTKRALNTTSSWNAAGANQSESLTTLYLDPADNLWHQKTTVSQPQIPSGGGPAVMAVFSSSDRTLGMFGAAGAYSTAMGNWLPLSQQTTYSGGAAVTERSYRLPGTALTRTLRLVDGTPRLSITGYNGLDVLYDTAGTTYNNKLAAFTPLREPLSNVDAASGHWTSMTRTPSTGLPWQSLLPSGTVKQTFTYFLGDDVRAGRMSSSLYAATGAATVYYDYNARGQRIRVWGGESPAETGYDSLGRMTTLSTYRGGTAWTGSTWPAPASTGTADTTEWAYPNYLSLQLSKKYPDAGGQNNARRTVSYSYHPNGSLATRTWQRMSSNPSITAPGAGIVTSYFYDAYARLATIDYPVGGTNVAATPDVTFTYQPAGHISTRTEAGQATTTYRYSAWGAASKETVISVNTSSLPSSVVERTFDTFNRPDLLKVQVGTAPAAPDVDYGFTATGLLNTATSDLRTITYGYDNAGTQPTALTYAHNGSTLLSTARPTPNGLVSGITHNQGSTLLQSIWYSYDIDRVTSMGRDSSEANWQYRYDSRGQVTSADKKYQYSGFYGGGLQTDYTYDMAGNRLTKRQGGDGASVENSGTRQTIYGAANALNQYPTVTHPWASGTTWLDVSGQRATTTETIKVNTLTANYQQGYQSTHYTFYKELALTPTANQRYVDVTVSSTTPANVTTTLDSGKAYVPPASESLTYDADGNLTQDARWIYTYDAENRLASMVPAVVVPNSARIDTKLYFTYDGLSRRVSRRSVNEIYAMTAPGNYSLVNTYTFRRAFTYDAWNMVQSLDSGYYLGDFNDGGTPASRLSFVWGPDIGSPTHGHTSWQKAGGVGGLLAVLAPAANPTGCQFPLMDRMGNVTGYRRAVSGTPAALDAMPYRFSTKYTDAETGLVYYGYRFYDPDRGRWLNRDPIGEKGGRNLYEMVGNNAKNSFDILGLFLPLAIPAGAAVAAAAVAAIEAGAAVGAAAASLALLIYAMATAECAPDIKCFTTGEKGPIGPGGELCFVQCTLNGVPLPQFIIRCPNGAEAGTPVSPPASWDGTEETQPTIEDWGNLERVHLPKTPSPGSPESGGGLFGW
jgi:RHS repeat-associated protein